MHQRNRRRDFSAFVIVEPRFVIRDQARVAVVGQLGLGDVNPSSGFGWAAVTHLPGTPVRHTDQGHLPPSGYRLLLFGHFK